MNSDTTQTESKKRFRFSLRAALILLTILCGVLGWIGAEVSRINSHQRSVEYLDKVGARVVFDENIQPSDKWLTRFLKAKLEMPAKSHKVVGIVANRFPEFNRLKYFENLQYLKLAEPSIDDLSPLRKLKQLETLSVIRAPNQSGGITDLSPLSDLTSLRRLEFQNHPIENVDVLAGLANLEALTLTGATNVDSLAPLENLVLKRLNVDNTSVCDLSPVEPVALERLSCNGCCVSDLSPLANAKNLNRLELRGNPISDIQGLNSVGLRFLDLSHTKVANTPTLPLGLYELKVNGTNLKNLSGINKSAFDHCTTSSKLTIGGRALESLEGIENFCVKQKNFWGEGYNLLPSISTLAVVDSSIKDLKPLKKIADLKPPVDLADHYGTRELVIDGAPIGYFSSDEVPQYLGTLRLRNTQIQEFAITRPMPRLKVIDLSNSPVHTLSGLKLAPGLESLILAGTKIDLDDVAQLREMRRLEELDLSDCKELRFDQKPAFRFKLFLKRLNLAGTSFSNLIHLSGSNKFSGLDLARTRIKSLDGIGRILQRGARLNLSGTDVKNISPLVDENTYFHLTFCDLSHTPFTDLHQLNGLQGRIRELDISHTNAKGFDVFDKTVNVDDVEHRFELIRLNMAGVDVTNQQLETLHRMLPECDIKLTDGEEYFYRSTSEAEKMRAMIIQKAN